MIILKGFQALYTLMAITTTTISV